MSDNRIQIETAQLKIELEGDAEHLREAYEALRPVLTRRLEATISEQNEGEEHTGSYTDGDTSSRSTTRPMHQYEQSRCEKSEIKLVKETGLAENRRQFVVCSEMCNRVASLTRGQFDETMFSDLLDYDAVHSFYVSQQAAEQLEGNITFGRTLWRKLTPQGHAAISNEGDLP